MRSRRHLAQSRARSQHAPILTEGGQRLCREKYIESQLAKRLGKRRKSEGEDDGADPQAEEDDLYNIPDNLKVRKL